MQLHALGLLATGGAVHTSIIADNSSAVVGNLVHTSRGMAASVENEPLVATLLDIGMAAAFHQPGFNMRQRLNDLQAELCSLTMRVGANGTLAVGGLELGDAASAMVCRWAGAMPVPMPSAPSLLPTTQLPRPPSRRRS